MKERPILFNDEMVRAVLYGRKTQTRRVVKPQPHGGPRWTPVVVSGHGGWTDAHGAPIRSPYGQPGDRLWVREAWRVIEFAPVGLDEQSESEIDYRATPNGLLAHCDERWTPSIHMPRWASRITLEITDVRVERLQEITEADAKAEGCSGGHGAIPGYRYNARPEEHFYHVWDSINGPGSWDENPWVWVIEFKRVGDAGEVA